MEHGQVSVAGRLFHIHSALEDKKLQILVELNLVPQS
jgi:hypothetical protein